MKIKRLLFTFLIFISLISFSQTKKTPSILVSPKGLVHSFWVTVKAGAEAAGKDFGANIIWKGPTVETDIAGQMDIVMDYINKNIDAIVIATCDTKALNHLLKMALNKGIEVITIDSGIESDMKIPFIATDNVLAAKKGADALANLIDKKGKVALIPFVPGAATSIMREEGFKEGIKKYSDLDLVAVQYSQSEVATAMAVTENILTAHPDLKGIFAANEAGTIGAIQALKAKGLIGKVKLVGFDAAENEIEALKKDELQALIVQDPFKMGYLGVKYAIDAINGKEIEERIDTGVYVITKDNLNTEELQRLLYDR